MARATSGANYARVHRVVLEKRASPQREEIGIFIGAIHHLSNCRGRFGLTACRRVAVRDQRANFSDPRLFNSQFPHPYQLTTCHLGTTGPDLNVLSILKSVPVMFMRSTLASLQPLRKISFARSLAVARHNVGNV